MLETKRLTGRIAPERIKAMAVPRPPAGAVERFLALGDPTGIVSDVMDELGIAAGVIGASVLRPTIVNRAIVGPALTVPTSTGWPSSRRTIWPRLATCWSSRA
jgi:4-hydroxy-4-methyl-2-oxoglutarate aldolase